MIRGLSDHNRDGYDSFDNTENTVTVFFRPRVFLLYNSYKHVV